MLDAPSNFLPLSTKIEASSLAARKERRARRETHEAAIAIAGHVRDYGPITVIGREEAVVATNYVYTPGYYEIEAKNPQEDPIHPAWSGSVKGNALYLYVPLIRIEEHGTITLPPGPPSTFPQVENKGRNSQLMTVLGKNPNTFGPNKIPLSGNTIVYIKATIADFGVGGAPLDERQFVTSLNVETSSTVKTNSYSTQWIAIGRATPSGRWLPNVSITGRDVRFVLGSFDNPGGGFNPL